MRILLVEDTEEHLEKAKKQLAEHHLVIAKDFTEAVNALYGGIDTSGNLKVVKKPKFDALLVDMNMPLGSTQLPSHNYRLIYNSVVCAQKDSYGSLICLLALQNRVKNICIVTDAGDHHHDSIVAAIAMINTFSSWAEGKGRLVKMLTEKDWSKALSLLTT